MTTIDLGKIKPGDRVRVSWKGLEGWQTVTERGGTTYAREIDVWLRDDSVGVLEHVPAPTKIEVELPEPEPGKWYCEGGAPSDWVGATGYHGIFVRVDLREEGAKRQEVYLSSANAEAFALCVLSIARSLKGDS